MLVSKAVFSKMAGVSRAAVTNACKKTGSLYEAVCGKQIDTNSEPARAYVRKKGLNPSTVFSDAAEINQPTQTPLRQVKPEPEKMMPTGDADPRDFENMSLSRLCEIFGTDDRFKIWASARKTLTEIRKNDLANAKASGELVSRDLVKRGIIEPIDTAHIKLLTDGAKSMAVRASALIKAGEPVEDVEKYIVGQISSHIKPFKSKVKRALKEI